MWKDAAIHGTNVSSLGSLWRHLGNSGSPTYGKPPSPIPRRSRAGTRVTWCRKQNPLLSKLPPPPTLMKAKMSPAPRLGRRRESTSCRPRMLRFPHCGGSPTTVLSNAHTHIDKHERRKDCRVSETKDQEFATSTTATCPGIGHALYASRMSLPHSYAYVFRP